MLPDAFLTHLRQICTQRFADAWSALAQEQDRLARESANRGLSGSFVGPIASAYEADLDLRARIVRDSIEEALRDFHYGIEPGDDEGLVSLAGDMFKAQADALRDGFRRMLLGYGLLESTWPMDSLHLKQAACTASVLNGVRQHLWRLRNVPAKRPLPAPETTHVAIHTVNGNVLTESHVTATIHQTFNPEALPAFLQAIRTLREQLQTDTKVPDNERAELVSDLVAAEAEARQPSPSRSRLARIVSGVGTAVQVLGSAAPALEAVKAAAKAMGIPV